MAVHDLEVAQLREPAQVRVRDERLGPGAAGILRVEPHQAEPPQAGQPGGRRGKHVAARRAPVELQRAEAGAQRRQQGGQALAQLGVLAAALSQCADITRWDGQGARVRGRSRTRVSMHARTGTTGLRLAAKDRRTWSTTSSTSLSSSTARGYLRARLRKHTKLLLRCPGGHWAPCPSSSSPFRSSSPSKGAPAPSAWSAAAAMAACSGGSGASCSTRCQAAPPPPFMRRSLVGRGAWRGQVKRSCSTRWQKQDIVRSVPLSAGLLHSCRHEW